MRRRVLLREIRALRVDNARLARRDEFLTCEGKRHQEEIEGLRQQVTSATRAPVRVETDETTALREQLAERDVTIRGLVEQLAEAIAAVEAHFEPDAEGWTAEDELRDSRRQCRELEAKVAQLQAANESMETWRKAPKQVAS